MKQWWKDNSTDVKDLGAEVLAQMRHAYFRTFYEHPEGRQVLAHLRHLARTWPGNNDQCIALEDMLNLIKVFCLVDELETIKGEAKVAQAASLPEPQDPAGIPGYTPGAFDEQQFNQPEGKE